MTFLLSRGLRSLVLIILSLAFLWSIPGTIGSPTLGNFVPKNFEVNVMAVDPHGDFGVGSFYAMDPTVIPWNVNKTIYKYTVVTLVVSNSNVTDLSSSVGINVPSSLTGIIPFKAILIIQGLQVNAPAIVSDIESVFGMPSGSFLALTSNPVTLPLSVFGADISPASQYPGFVNAFVGATTGKAAVIGKYTPSLLEGSSSAIFFNSIESLAWPVSPIFGQSGATGLTAALFRTYFDDAVGLNSTGVVVVHKNYFDFSGAASHTLDFNSFLGVPSITSGTNETFATILPNGANVTGFSPSSMLVESSDSFGGTSGSSLGMTAVVGVFPWLGSAPRLLPDVKVSFYYPAFDSPVLSATETTTPSPFAVGHNFTLTLSVSNSGRKDATDLHFKLDFSGVNTWNQTAPYTNNQLTYNVTSLAMGATDTHKFSFLSLLPEAEFVLNAVYLDSSSFAYSWHTVFSLAANVNTNGPLTVTKTVNPTSPAYGQMGNVTVTITNNSPTQTFYNVVDTTPEALPFLYPTGGSPPSNGPCPYLPYGIAANTTRFIFTVQNYCGPTVLTQVLIKHGNQATFQLVDSPNIPLQYQAWSPLNPYPYPGGATLNNGESVTLQLTLQNFAPLNQSYCCVFQSPLSYNPENPNTPYLSIACSPCLVGKGGGKSLISGRLVNAGGGPIAQADIGVLYSINAFGHDASKSFAFSARTDSLGQFSYNWAGLSQLPVGTISLYANYVPSSNCCALATIQINLVNPTTISPSGTITLSYPYWFNVTGPLTLEPERIIYSSVENITTNAQKQTTQPLLGEYVALSNNVTGINVGAAGILPLVATTIDTTKLSFLYVAQNQTTVRIHLIVTNTGSQTATNVVVTASIPHTGGYCYPVPCNHFLPVVDPGTVTSVDSSRGTVTFSAGTLQSGQTATASYVVKMLDTNLYFTDTNVTAQGPTGTLFQFRDSGAVLGGYPTINRPSSASSGSFFQNSLQTGFTTSSSVFANGTQTTVTLHLYNEGNSTLTNIVATLSSPNYFGYADLTVAPAFATVPDMPPWTSQTVTFTVTDHTSGPKLVTTLTGEIDSGVTYNQGSAVGDVSSASTRVLVYNSRISNFNPNVKVDVSVGQSIVTAGTAVVAVVTITNIGTSNATNIQVNLQRAWPELTYGSTNMRWDLLEPGQTVKFRLGIQTRPAGLHMVLVGKVYYNYYLPGSNVPQGSPDLSGSSAGQIRATGGAGPTISTPWASPFAPKPTDNVNVWAMMSNSPNAIGTADLDYSTNNKQSFATIPMTSMIATYSNPGVALIGQVFAGDIYNGTIPAQAK